MSGDPEIVFDRSGAAGLVTLNRPMVLNALTFAMVTALRSRLQEWERDDSITCVVIRGAGFKAFCAGGDIRALHDSGKAGTSYASDFWREEYILNAAIKHYRKPFVALIHGICMGGGIGVSVHGRFRIVTESALLAMPETAIGFFPDVGGSYILSRCPGQLGMYLALTGARLKSVDATYAGLATHYLPADRWPVLLDALSIGERPANVLAEMSQAPAPSAPLSDLRAQIDVAFAASSVEGILANLDADGSAWAQETAATIRRRSPMSLKIAYREVRTGRTLGFDDCMRMEYRIANRILHGHDFYEGIRAAIIDKDNAARWLPGRLEDVADDIVASHFESLGNGELRL
ncbi:MAG: enoyl-CoA hydratase/isomerase family protein [Alphaproteobacteria bacterium]|nr:enoyl-CoA hydratase/isomerase family protein [Alphaproteobacteria bacterium]